MLTLVTLFLTSCANKYELLRPEQAYYQSINKENGIEVSYKYNSLRKKYRKYAQKNDIKIISIKIKNTTDKDLIVGTDFTFTTYENGQLNLLAPQESLKTIKQKPASHLLYLLLTPVTLNKNETSEQGPFTVTESKPIFPIGLILGPAISLGNMVTANKANKTFLQELESENLINKKIKKGETVYGLITIRQNDYPSIKASLLK